MNNVKKLCLCGMNYCFLNMAFLTETTISKQTTKPMSRRLMIAVRIRPLKTDETGRILHSINDQVIVLEENEADKNDVLRQNRGGDRHYIFDAVFGEHKTQEAIFEKTTKDLVRDVLEGYNATIFAYGASGSGKTHTMLGTTVDPGVMVRALNEIFHFVRNSTFPNNFNVTMSYLEIYNENIRDLLNPESGFLELREDYKEKTVHVVKLSEISTNSTEEMMKLLQKGNKARTIEPTALNKTSSRSHALLSVTVRQTFSLNSDEKLKARVKQGKLFMIDLAGSERASQTKNHGKRLVEGAHINRSLLALGNCINALSGGARYVNYRDSKLTRLLKDALSGNSQTCMIAHVSPAVIHREESKNTLLYAERAKNISNKVEKNIMDISYHVSQYRTIISELRNEVARLKAKMPENKELNSENSPKINRMPKEVEGKKGLEHLLTTPDHLTALKNEIIFAFREQMKLRKRLLNIENYLLELDAEADRQRSIILECEGKSNSVYRNNSSYGGMPEKPDLESLDLDYQEIERNSKNKSFKKALIELALIEKEQEKYLELKGVTEKELDKCKDKATIMGKELPYEINSEEEKELLSLIIRVYELEIEKIALQSERLTKEHALRQKDFTILRFGRQKQICEEIITRQRQLLEEKKLELPQDLQELYQLYHCEVYSSYSDHNLDDEGLLYSSDKLPPILTKRLDYAKIRAQSSDNGVDDSDNSFRTPSSSAGSDWIASPLPPISRNQINSYLINPTLPPATVLFPPISKQYQDLE